MKLSTAMERLDDILRDDNTPWNVLALPSSPKPSTPCHSLIPTVISSLTSTPTPTPTPTPALQFAKRSTTPPVPPWVSAWSIYGSEYPNLGPGGHPTGPPPNLGASNTASTSSTSSGGSSATSSSSSTDKSSTSAMTTETSTSTSTVIVESVSTINPPQSTAQNSTLGATSHPISTFSKGALAGVIIGSLIALLLIAAVLFLVFYIRRRRAQSRRGPVEGEVVAQIRVPPPTTTAGNHAHRRTTFGRNVVSENPPDEELEEMEDKAILVARDRALERDLTRQTADTRQTGHTGLTFTSSQYPYSIEPPPTPSSTGGGVGRDFGSYGPATPSSRALPSSDRSRSRSPFSPVSAISPISHSSDSHSLSLPGAPYPTRSDPSPTQRTGTGTRTKAGTRRGLRVSTGPLGQDGGQGSEGEGGEEEGERHRDAGSWSDREEREEYDGPALTRSPSGRLPPAYER